MSPTLTGIRDATYLATFLGKKIAIQDSANPNKYYLFPKLWSICADGMVTVHDKKGNPFIFAWERCQSPYIVLDEDMEIEIV